MAARALRREAAARAAGAAASPLRPAARGAGGAASSSSAPGPGDRPSGRPRLRLLPRRRRLKGGDARVSRLVPWVYRNEAANVDELRALGVPAALVSVESSEGRELGTAICNLQRGGKTGVNILARMLSDNVSVPIDSSFFAARIRRALLHRERSDGVPPFYRLANAEGDMLPGILCDRYGADLCVQFSAAGAELLLEQEVLDALEATLSPRCIVVRRDDTPDRELELAPAQPPVVARGRYEGPTAVVHPTDVGFSYAADLLASDWSPGRSFLERRQRGFLVGVVARLASGAGAPPRVLSLFGESSGVACAAAGARATCVVGLGEVGQARLEDLAARNGCRSRVECVHAEAPQALPSSLGRGVTFDVVAIEPPPLAPTYGRLEEGSQQYAAWVAAAAATARPGGLLLVACRSRTMSAVRLLRCVNLGVWSARRRAGMVQRWAGGGWDFPSHLALNDTTDLQVMALRLD